MKKLVTRHLVKNFDIAVNNNLYGGRTLDWLDEAGALFVREEFPRRQFVTVKISETVFHKPVHCNEILRFYVVGCNVGNTSVTLNIEVRRDEELIFSTRIVFVSVDGNGRPAPVK